MIDKELKVKGYKKKKIHINMKANWKTEFHKYSDEYGSVVPDCSAELSSQRVELFISSEEGI